MKEKAKYKLGEKVICVKYDIHEIFNFTNEGTFLENRVDKDYFGREAIISDVQREEIDTEYGKMKQDVDEYGINFLDEKGGSIAWISGSDLIPVCVKLLGVKLHKINRNDCSPLPIGSWTYCKDKRKIKVGTEVIVARNSERRVDSSRIGFIGKIIGYKGKDAVVKFHKEDISYIAEWDLEVL